MAICSILPRTNARFPYRDMHQCAGECPAAINDRAFRKRQNKTVCSSFSALHKLFMQGKTGAVLTVMIMTRHIHHTALLFLCLSLQMNQSRIDSDPAFITKGN